MVEPCSNEKYRYHWKGSAQAAEKSIVLESSTVLFNRLQKSLPTDYGVLLLNLARGMARSIRELNDMLVEHNINH